jgi:mono/diheme cytochrome c family protein
VEVSSAFVRLKFRALAVAVALAAISGPSVAQDSGKSGVAAAPAASGDAAKLDKGRGANCHSLADAGATGHVGPSLDGNANLTQEFVVERVTNGQGMMPSFGGQLSADEINAVAAYIVKVATK